MKFTKNEAYKELVAKMTANGEALNLSERSINENLEKLIPLVANEETELADFVTKVLPFMKTADANVRNDTSVAIKEYKEKNPIVEKKTPVNKENMTDVEKRLLALEEQNARSEKAKKELENRNKLRKEMKSKGITNDAFIEMMSEKTSISDDFDATAEAEKLVEYYNKISATESSSRTPYRTNKSAESFDKDFEAIKALRERKLKEQGVNI